VLLNTPSIAEKIFKGEFTELKGVMNKSREVGMRTFDWALFELYNEYLISYEDAIRNADSANELRLNIKLKSKRGEPTGKAAVELTMTEEPSAEELREIRRLEMERQEQKRNELEEERLRKLREKRNVDDRPDERKFVLETRAG
jgi:twitching motility protein PilU